MGWVYETSGLANIVIVLVSLSFGVLAAPVANIAIDVTQPDSEVPGGKPFKVHQKGDEWQGEFVLPIFSCDANELGAAAGQRRDRRV